MEKIENLIKKIDRLLTSEVPEKYSFHVVEFRNLVSKDLLRAAYSEVDELRRKPDWHPSAVLEGAIFNFQRVF
jgi:hypothetical protein